MDFGQVRQMDIDKGLDKPTRLFYFCCIKKQKIHLNSTVETHDK